MHRRSGPIRRIPSRHTWTSRWRTWTRRSTGWSSSAAVLAQAVPHLPTAVHVAVVDPGVGSSRRGIAIEAEQGVLVGPDNGLLPPAADALGGVRRAVQLTNPSWFNPSVSPTFHGRD